jgi:hypothetical protein
MLETFSFQFVTNKYQHNITEFILISAYLEKNNLTLFKGIVSRDGGRGKALEW